MMSNIRQKGSEPEYDEYDEYDENPTKSNRNLYIGLGIAAVIISLIIYFVVYKPQRDAAAAAYLVRPGVWRKGSIGGDYSKRKLAELFNGTYPKDLPQCINRAKNSNYKYIAANSQDGKPLCVFYNDDGVVIPSTVSAGDIVDIENTSYTGILHYAVP